MTGDVSLIPGSGRSPGEGNGNYSSILAWEIPWTEEPGGLQSMRLQKSQRWFSHWTKTTTNLYTKLCKCYSRHVYTGGWSQWAGGNNHINLEVWIKQYHAWAFYWTSARHSFVSWLSFHPFPTPPSAWQRLLFKCCEAQWYQTEWKENRLLNQRSCAVSYIAP